MPFGDRFVILMQPMLDEQQFRLHADTSLERLQRLLLPVADKHDFETDFGGALTVEFEDPPARFVVSPNAPVRQIWVSAHSKSYKLDWEPGKSEFVLSDTGQTLPELIAEAITKQIGTSVMLGG